MINVHYTIDNNHKEILQREEEAQIMMEWERPYMEACIDKLNPRGNVLEIGFGCGYSATQIMKYQPKSYTIIECEPVVIEKINEWKKQFNIPIYIVEGRWQEKLHTLDFFDEIFFDDYPLDITKESTLMECMMSHKRFKIFTDLCIQNHMHIGSKISAYLNGTAPILLGSDSAPFTIITQDTMNIKIPDNCKYRDLKEQKCSIPLITKIKEYNFKEAQQYALEEINNFNKK